MRGIYSALRLLIPALAVAVVFLWSVPSSNAADGLTLPITGFGVGSWFDHTSPTVTGYYYDNNPNVMTRYDGTTEWSYNGHAGIDYPTGQQTGYTVVAATSGVVAFVGWENPNDQFQGFGYNVRVWHAGLNYSTLYGHLLPTAVVSVGQAVARGQLLGYSGNTGYSSGPHLHFGVYTSQTGWTPIDPYGWSGGGADPWSYDRGYLWSSNPPVTVPSGWQPVGAYQNYGTLWGGGVTEEATASALDMSQSKFVALARVNATAGGTAEWRQWNYNGGGQWNSWTTISGLTGINGKIAMSNHLNGSQEQLHVAAVKNGDVWYTSKVGTGAWGSWLNLSHPPGVTFDGAVAISNSDVRVVVAGISGGNVYVRLRYSGSWGLWVALGGGNTLTGSIAIGTRPNGTFHIAALRFDGHVFVDCSANYATWTGWADIGWVFGDALAIDNDAAPSGSCGVGSYPGVVVLAFSGLVGYVFCWEPYCPLYESIGGAVGNPAAISNAVNPYAGNIRWIDVAVRSGDNELHRYKVY